MFLAAIDWSTMTDGLTAAFEGAVTSVLPVAAVILAAFIAFKAIKRFVN